jgi:hypothetical protein
MQAGVNGTKVLCLGEVKDVSDFASRAIWRGIILLTIDDGEDMPALAGDKSAFGEVF